MTKRKVLKIQVGEAYDKENKKNLPVYASYWENEDGSYTRIEKVFVNQVDVPDKQVKQNKIEA